MDILGVGPLEFIFILIIALVVLGPKDLAKTGRSLGRILRQIITSQWWSGIRQTSLAMKKLPTKLMRDANIEDALRDINEFGTITRDISQTSPSDGQKGFKSWIYPANSGRDQWINAQKGQDDILPDQTQTPPSGG